MYPRTRNKRQTENRKQKARNYVQKIVAVTCLTNLFQIDSIYIIYFLFVNLQFKLSTSKNTAHVLSLYIVSLLVSFITNYRGKCILYLETVLALVNITLMYYL